VSRIVERYKNLDRAHEVLEEQRVEKASLVVAAHAARVDKALRLLERFESLARYYGTDVETVFARCADVRAGR
jgi:hypothetical protein